MVCRHMVWYAKLRSTPILNSAYHTKCRFVIHHITQTDMEMETEASDMTNYKSADF